MSHKRGTIGGLIALMATVLLAAPPAQAVGRVDREGVYNLGGWFQYGLVEGDSRYGLDFSDGPGYSLHFRYHMSRKAAFVLYFDNQTFDATADSVVDFTMTSAHVGFRLFSVPPGGDVLRYVELSAGFYRPEIRFPETFDTISGGDYCFPAENFLVHAGAGAEIFFSPSWAVEFGLHGYGFVGRGLCRTEVDRGEGNFSVSGQLVIGIDYFLLR
jgi:hypothetical protein